MTRLLSLLFPTSLLLAGTALAFRPTWMPLSLMPLTATGLALGVAMLLERVRPRVARDAEPGETRADVLWFVWTGLASRPLAAAAVAALAAWVHPTNGADGWTSWFVVDTVATLLVLEFGDYWAHRLAHTQPWWWKLHAVHHAPHRMTALNNARLHPLDVLLKELFIMLPVLLLAPKTEVLVAAATLRGVGVAFQHADVDLHHGWLNWVFSTNSNHRWHHSNAPQEAHANYGGFLMVFDHLFGTYLNKADADEPAAMGLFDDDGYPVHQVVRSTAAPVCWRRCVGAP